MKAQILDCAIRVEAETQEEIDMLTRWNIESAQYPVVDLLDNDGCCVRQNELETKVEAFMVSFWLKR